MSPAPQLRNRGRGVLLHEPDEEGHMCHKTAIHRDQKCLEEQRLYLKDGQVFAKVQID
jgi:hypothetical protein